MNPALARLTARFDALQRRERALLAAALVGGILMLGSTAFIEPALKRQKLFTQQLSQQQADLASQQAQILVLRSQLQDPEKALRSQLDEARKKTAAIDAELKKAGDALVPPHRVTALLEEFLTRNRGLRLLSMRTLPAQPLIERKAGDAAKPDSKSDTEGPAAARANIYRHGVEIRVEGSYADLTAYLTELERLPQRLLWGRVAVDAEHYPKIVMTLTVYTLSLDKSWLVV